MLPDVIFIITGSAKEKGNAALCELCAPGSYSDKLGQYICTPCPEDFYCHVCIHSFSHSEHLSYYLEMLLAQAQFL